MDIKEMEKTIEELKSRIEELEDQVSELELAIDDRHSAIIDDMPDSDLFNKIDEFSDLDEIPCAPDESVIVFHTNSIRSAMLAKELEDSCLSRNHIVMNLNNIDAGYFQPSDMMRSIENAEKGNLIIVKSSIFETSDEIEKMVFEAVKENKISFAIFTNNLEKIPQCLRDILRVIQ